MTRDDVVLFVLVALALVGKASPQSAACVLPCRHQSRPCFVSVVRGGFAAQFGRRAGRSVAAGASCSVSPVLWGTPQRTPSGCKLLGRSLLIARTTPRSCCVLRAGPEANEADAAGDDLGVLLRAWGVDDARLALEANGFTTVQRVRDVLEVDDLPELGLPLATRKILARLIKHLADGKRVEAEAELAKKVAGHLETGSTSNEFRDDEAGREAAAVAAAAAKQKQKEVDVLYNSEATKTRRRWEPFHRAVSEKMAAEAGNFQLRGIEEIELDAPINDEALDTSLMPRSEEDDELPDTVSLSSERGGGRFGTARRRMLAPPPPPEPGKKTKRHFRYRSREGDFFVKVVLTGEPTDDRCEQQKEDDAGNLMSMFMDGNLEDGDFDLGDLDKLKGLDLGGDSGVVIGAGGAGGGLILDIPDSLKLDLFGEDKEARKGLKYPHNLYEGEQQSLGMLRRTGQMRAPAPIVAGDLLDPDYVANHRMDAGRPRSDLVSGGFGVLEWVELDRNLNPLVVSDVAQQLARVHLSSEGMSRDYGFSINTFLGERELDNTIKSNVDILDFFCTRRLEPEIDAASRSSAQRASKISPKLLDEIGTKGFKVCRPRVSGLTHLACATLVPGRGMASHVAPPNAGDTAPTRKRGVEGLGFRTGTRARAAPAARRSVAGQHGR
jgi:hypothetical protein